MNSFVDIERKFSDQTIQLVLGASRGTARAVRPSSKPARTGRCRDERDQRTAAPDQHARAQQLPVSALVGVDQVPHGPGMGTPVIPSSRPARTAKRSPTATTWFAGRSYPLTSPISTAGLWQLGDMAIGCTGKSFRFAGGLTFDLIWIAQKLQAVEGDGEDRVETPQPFPTDFVGILLRC